VVGLADGRVPSAPALKDKDGEEEERRLFYVGCTRARDELYLGFPVVAAPRDRERVVMKPSRFLEELSCDPPVYERWQLDDAAGPPALVVAEEPARLAPAPAAALLVPALFGDDRGQGGRMEERGGGGDDVPF
jgi:DNA helicase-2/ATP-dependent DNA helicase PcrA